MAKIFLQKNQSDLYVPHVDQILGESDRVRVTGNRDGPVGDSALSVVAVRDSDHRARNLSDFGDFGAAFADDAADQFVGHGHLVSLLIRVLLISCV